MRILILFDLDQPTDPACLDASYYQDDLRDENWEAEASVLRSLRLLGHETRLFGVCDDARKLAHAIESFRPDVVFNLAEAFRNDRGLEPQIAGLLELLGVRYTGARPVALQLCKDKALAKSVVAQGFTRAPVRGVRVPQFALCPRKRPIAGLTALKYPAIVKPVSLESSMGISRESLVRDARSAATRVRFVHDRYEQDAIVEEYIEGRELYMSCLGRWDGRIELYPPRELFFGRSMSGPRLATYRAKWNDAYRRANGIRSGFAAKLEPSQLKTLRQASTLIYRALKIDGYARIDYRLSSDGELVFLEANPNPSIAATDDFARSAARAGIEHPRLIERIIELSAE